MKCECGETMDIINGVPVCPVCDIDMNKCMDENKWVQGGKNEVRDNKKPSKG